MTLAAALFSYGPYFALFGFLAARMYRWGILRDQVAAPAEPIGPAAEGALALGFAALAVGHLTTLLAPGAMRALLSDPDRIAVVETVGLTAALLFAWGIGARLRSRVRALRAGRPRQGGPVVVLSLLLAVALSGAYLAVSQRWITVWYAYIWVPFARSLLVLEPQTGAMAASPWVLQQHVLLLLAFAAAWPMAALPLEEIFPLRAVARRFVEGSIEAGGDGATAAETPAEPGR